VRSRLAKVTYSIRRYRRASQVAVLLLLITAPFLHIFRFDLPSMSLYLFGMRLWVRHIFLFSLLVTLIIYVVIAVSFLFGRIFCGWVCPQNLFNEVLRTWDARLGRKGSTALSALVGLLGGFVIWSYGTDGLALLRQYAAGEVPVAPTMTILGIGAFFTLAIAWWRTTVCKVVCPYGHLQSIISNSSTMRLALFNLPQNRDICASCGLCFETCHIDVDPRTLEQKHCVACGDCLDACRLVSEARKVPRVLNFVVGAGVGRVALPALLALILAGATAYGLFTRPLVEVTVAKDHRQVMTAGGSVSGGGLMRVSLMNLGTAAETFRLSVNGLPEGWARLEHEEMSLLPGERRDVALRVVPSDYRKGIYPFTVTALGLSMGVQDEVKAVHVVGN